MARPLPYTNAPIRSRPEARLIRFSGEEVKDMRRAAARARLSVQAFCLGAIMRAANEELGRADAAPAAPAPARGLGIRDRLAAEDAARRGHADESDVPAAAPVVVQVQTAAPAAPDAASDEISRLARDVVDAPQFVAELERACEVLKARYTTPEERLAAADKLDAEIRRLRAAAPQSMLEKVRARRAARGRGQK